MSRITRLDELARDHVGDGRKPNVFFVTDKGKVLTVTIDFELAYRHWEQLAARRPLVECALEDRKNGVLASVEPVIDGSTVLEIRDDAHRFVKGG